MIEVFTKDNCMACKMTKIWLKDNGFSYKETNVDDDLNKRIQKWKNFYQLKIILIKGGK